VCVCCDGYFKQGMHCMRVGKLDRAGSGPEWRVLVIVFFQGSKFKAWEFMAVYGIEIEGLCFEHFSANTWLGRDLTTVHMQLVQKYSHQKSPNLYYTKAMHRVQTTSPNLIALIPYFSSLIHFDSTRRGFTQDHLPRVARFRESRGSFEAKILCKNWEDFNTLHRSSQPVAG
jgi:hypothetical protein